MRTKPEKLYVTYLTVSGHGDFPIDMLRYDRCVPRTQIDVENIQRRTVMLDGKRVDEPRLVNLVRYCVSDTPAEAGRWQSFGWKVVREEPKT